MAETCNKCGTPMRVATKTDKQVLWKCPICGQMELVQVIERNEVR